jgi:hypothetical protein
VRVDASGQKEMRRCWRDLPWGRAHDFQCLLLNILNLGHVRRGGRVEARGRKMAGLGEEGLEGPAMR